VSIFLGARLKIKRQTRPTKFVPVPIPRRVFLLLFDGLGASVRARPRAWRG